MRKFVFFLSVLPMLMTACYHPRIPKTYTDSDQLPSIRPDYVGVTIPVNIAPLSFCMSDSIDEVVARFQVGKEEIVCGGEKIQPNIDDWHRLASMAANKEVSIEVYARKADNWIRYRPFNIFVSADSIDPYISYRLVSPSYVVYKELTLNQRCLENYEERIMVSNVLGGSGGKKQCVNCHSYQHYNPRRMQFHARQANEGTVIAYDGRIWKVNMQRDSLLSGGVYPAWHPWLPLIAYSMNNTGQSFHTRHNNKIEVFDAASGLILYDIENDKVNIVENDPAEFEVFPCWSPDGRALYFCSAHFEFNDTSNREREVVLRAEEIRYNIYRKSFDPVNRVFGPRELIFRADSLGRSATFPRVSPDGRYLMFTLGNYGVFHIWHHEADLYLMDLDNGSVWAMDNINSPDTESYHAWSGNGRWVMFSSRRNDGNYTRLFFAHVDADGKDSKPFELPQDNPAYHHYLLKSYNVPEFMRGPVEFTPQDFAKIQLVFNTSE